MPFKSDKQRKACFATKGFNGKVDCHEWAKKSKMKYRGKQKMQGGGEPKREDYSSDEEFFEAIRNHQMQSSVPSMSALSYRAPAQQNAPFNWRGNNRSQEQPVCPEGWTWSAPDNMCVKMPFINIMDRDPAISAPQELNPDGTPNYGSMMASMMNNPNAPVKDPGVNLGPSLDPEDKQLLLGLETKNKGNDKLDPYFLLQGLQSGLAWLGNKKERGRQNQYMWDQYTTLGQNDPVNVNDYQPTNYSPYAQYGGQLRRPGMHQMPDGTWMSDAEMNQSRPIDNLSPYNEQYMQGLNQQYQDIYRPPQRQGDRWDFFQSALQNQQSPNTVSETGWKISNPNTPGMFKMMEGFQDQPPTVRPGFNREWTTTTAQVPGNTGEVGRLTRHIFNQNNPTPRIYQYGGRQVEQVPQGYAPVPGQPNYFARGNTQAAATGQPQASNQDWAAFIASPAGQQWQAKQRQGDTVYIKPPVQVPVTPRQPVVQPVKGGGAEYMWTGNQRIMGTLGDVVREGSNNLDPSLSSYQNIRSFQPMNDLAQPTGPAFPIDRSRVFGTDRRLIPGGESQRILDSSRNAYLQQMGMAMQQRRMGGYMRMGGKKKVQLGGNLKFNARQAPIVTPPEVVNLPPEQVDAYVKAQEAEGRQFHSQWMGSPMYDEMLKASDPVNAAKIAATRQKNLSNVKFGYSPELLPEYPDAQGYYDGEGVLILPPGVEQNVQGLGVHEVSHAVDFPEGSFPESDEKKIIGFRQGPAALPQERPDKAEYEEYVADPTETRARLNEVRQKAIQNKIYDPFTQKLTKENYQKILQGMDPKDKSDGLLQLRSVFSDDQILELMNSISMNEGQSPTQAAMAKKGGWIAGAVNPAHKGYCTPMTKSTCTPRRKAFARRAKAHFKEDGGLVSFQGGGTSREDLLNPRKLAASMRAIQDATRPEVMNSLGRADYRNTTSVGPAIEKPLYQQQQDAARTQAYLTGHNARMVNGRLVPINPNRTMEGAPLPFTPAARLDRGVETIGTGLEAAGYLTGAGALGRAVAGEIVGAAAPFVKKGVASLKTAAKANVNKLSDALVAIEKNVGNRIYDFRNPAVLENITAENLPREIGSRIDNIGSLNKGIYNLRRFPENVLKFEDVDEVGKLMGDPNYVKANFPELMKNLRGRKDIAAVQHQFYTDPKTRGLVMNKVAGIDADKIPNKLLRNLPDEAIQDMYKNLKTVRDEGLGYDFVGANYKYDKAGNKLNILDINPPVDPNSYYWNNTVLGGGSEAIYGKEGAGKNLKAALMAKLEKDYGTGASKTLSGYSGNMERIEKLLDLQDAARDAFKQKLIRSLGPMSALKKGGKMCNFGGTCSNKYRGK